MEWTIFCPGPSLINLKDVEYNCFNAITVNGAITKRFPVRYWAMLDREVFRDCIKYLNGKEIDRIAATTRLWIPDDWPKYMKSQTPEVAHFFTLFDYEVYPLTRILSVAPFGQDRKWGLRTIFTAILLAIKKGAKLIRLYGADMNGQGYFKEGLENHRTRHTDLRWEAEIREFEAVKEECLRHGIEIIRVKG